MTDLIEKVAKAIAETDGDYTVKEHHRRRSGAAIEVVLREQRAWAEALPKPNFSPVAVNYIDAYARENDIDLEKP